MPTHSADDYEVRAFLEDRCICTGSNLDFVQSSVLIDALMHWRRDRALSAWTARTCATLLKEVAPRWRDPQTGMRPGRHKASVVGYLGLVLRPAPPANGEAE
jgi:hypothetical protein